jgi:hypothetical protein
LQQIWKNEENFIDLWIINKFSVLPTDERFLNLYEEQKAALFLGINDFPDLEHLKKVLIIKEKIREVNDKKLKDLVPKKRLEVMEMVFKKQGLSKDKIKEEINKYLRVEKQKILDKLEKEITE